ncbi:hypothetical protein IWX47DRAFT_281828 [Phyllosticta citricarpa]
MIPPTSKTIDRRVRPVCLVLSTNRTTLSAHLKSGQRPAQLTVERCLGVLGPRSKKAGRQAGSCLGNAAAFGSRDCSVSQSVGRLPAATKLSLPLSRSSTENINDRLLLGARQRGSLNTHLPIFLAYPVSRGGRVSSTYYSRRRRWERDDVRAPHREFSWCFCSCGEQQTQDHPAQSRQRDQASQPASQSARASNKKRWDTLAA